LKAFAHQLDTPHVPGLDLPGIDFVSLAKGYGVTAERISTPSDLAAALRRGMASERPHLVEVEIDPAVPPLI
jgi:benzoylformate decarboxylase